MEVYIIQHPYLGKKSDRGFLELEITSARLTYSEINETHNGVQCATQKNNDIIRHKCRQVADLVREIDELNR